MGISKDKIHRLAKHAAEIDARILRGVLKIGPDGATINEASVLEWLREYADEEFILIAAPVSHRLAQNLEVRTCQTCGRDYRGQECTHCAHVRDRLRGSGA